MDHSKQRQTSGPASRSSQISARWGYATPRQFFITISISIFVAEVIAMLVVYFIKPLPYYQTILIDAGVMLVLISPFLYFLSFRPLVQHIEMRRQAEAELQFAYDELELRVQERTQELRIANSELEGEIIERRKAEEAIKESEERYRSLFSNINEGFALHEIILDVDGSPCDYRFLELNNAFEELTGIKGERVLGKTVKEVLPNIEMSWIEAYGRVALTGEPVLFVNYSADLGKWYETYCYCPKMNQFAVLFFDITERKQAEEKLLYQSAILSNVNDAIVASDAEYRLTAWNSAAESLYGWKADEVIGRNGLEIMGTEWFEMNADKMRRTIAETGRWRGEATQQRKDGTRFAVEVSSIVLYDDHRQITGYISVNRDITARKHSEEALRQSQLDLYRAQEVGQIGSWRLDVRKDELAWSDETNRIFGIPKETPMTYESFLSTIHPDDRDYVNMKWDLALKGEPYDIEHRILVDGAIKWVREKAYLEFDEGSLLRGGFGITQDITERKQSEEALRASEEKFRRAFADAAIGFAMTTPDGRFLDANPAYCSLTGFDADELRISEFQNLIHPDDRMENMKLINQMLAGEIADFVIENRYHRKDGKNLWVRKSVSVVRDLDGSPQWIIALVENINERKQAEESLRLANNELELRVRERTEELAAANWELSNEVADRKEIERQLRIQTAAMDAAANGIVITDPQGVTLWGNLAMTQISGYAGDELVGKSTHIFSSGRQGPDFYHQMWETILAGKVWHGETTNRRKNGDLYVEEQTITPVQDENGVITHFIAVKQDVTERNLMYSQLESSNQELTTLTLSERQQRFLAEGLVESSVVLNMSLELHAVLDRIFEQTRRTIPYLIADIVLIEDRTATVVRQWGMAERFEERTSFENDKLHLQDFPIWERICAAKSVVMIPDTTVENQWNSYFGMDRIRSYLGAPLIYNDQVIGIINLIGDEPNTFHEEMAKNLRAFAAPAAVAIQNARLYENEQQNRKIAEILSAASVALSQTLDIQMVMETILDYVQFVLPCKVSFVLLSEGEEIYRIRAVRSKDDHIVSPDFLQDQTIDLLSEPVIRSYFDRYESTYIPDVREFSDWHPPLELASMNCWLGIPLESMGKILGIVMAAHTTPNFFTKDQIKLMEAVVKQAVVSLQNAWLFEQVRSGRERLQQLSRHLVELQENERKYIARELHDETSQSLTSLKLGLQVIEQNAAGHQELTQQVAKLKMLADETLESLHHLAVNLRPASLDHLGLANALTGLIESTRQRSGITAHFKVIGSMDEALLTNELETSIYRIVQESLTNVVRHAHAAHVDVILEWQDEKIVIIIEDDGVGIDPQTNPATNRLGLIGMQERAEMLGGKLLIDSAPQIGTTLVVEIPYANSNTFSR